MTATASSSFLQATQIAEVARVRRVPLLLRLFILSLVVPFFFQVGPIQMSVNRILLVLWFLPGLVMWLRGRAGPIRVADLALFGTCLWVALSYVVLHGFAVALEPSGINFIETMGAYLLARCYIRSADDFYAVVRMLFWVVLLMLPFAVFEMLTSRNILLELANRVTFSGWDVWKEPRWGLDRVQGVFQHPILFGIFCSGIVSLTYYVLGYQVPLWKRWGKTALVIVTAAMSLSSGPLTAIVAQLALILWDRLLRKIRQRWIILSGGILSMVVAIEIAATRSTPQIFISIFAFNIETAYNRIRIWQFGSLSVKDNPFFGVGLGDWARPLWMSNSLDMFWLFPAVIHGLPAALFLHLAFFALFFPVLFKSGLSDRSSNYRTGYLICMMGLYLAGWTVHYWKIIYALFLFLLGAGAWLLNDDDRDENEDAHPGENKLDRPDQIYQRSDGSPRYTRYDATHVRKGRL